MRTVKEQPPLPRTFFEQDPVLCARALVGCELVWRTSGGIVVETEAYAADGDEACHTFHRPSARMFVETHPAGSAYVYLNYGMYWLFNVLTKGQSGEGFVLIRALQPSRGIEQMRRRRPDRPDSGLCSGPGKLSLALGIDGRDHGRDLCAPRPVGFFRHSAHETEIQDDVRVGISKAAHLPWRFLLRGSGHVSVPHGKAKARYKVSRKSLPRSPAAGAAC